MIYLYVKTHNVTGLKYLGKTTKNPFIYLGSGLLWLKHLKKHGKDISTQVLLETTDPNEIREKGIYYSQLWNIVESDNWANLTSEEGTGGATFKNRKHSPETIQKMRNIKKGKLFTKEHKENLSKSHIGKSLGENNGFFNKHHSEESKRKMSMSLKGKVRTDEFKHNLSKMYKGKPKGPMSEETKQKISEAKRRKKDG